ncbi:MAG: bifunctional diguanylate cyclase/phosphodiesterase [Arcobacteraceae bacterium]|nr:bifunctional diguanylate cyclase/phosphodiesterase [Arcobacteraceae bacterium]
MDILDFSKHIAHEHYLSLIILVICLTIVILIFIFYYIKTTKNLQNYINQLETILSTASDGIHIHDDKGKIIIFSDSFASMLGYSRDEIYKLSIFDIDTHLTKSKIEENIESLKTQKIIFETKHTKKDGTLIDVEINAKTILLNKKPYIYSVSRDITQRKKHEANLIRTKEHFAYLAHHDSLTSLPNRLSLIEELDNMTSMNDSFALIFIDLDSFKEINDSYGHSIGDHLLVKIAELMKISISKKIFISRTSGDEFGLICPMVNANKALLTKTLDQLLKMFHYPIQVDTLDIFATACMGVSIYPQTARTTTLLLQQADIAMYRAKQKGKNTFSFYNEDLIQEFLEKTTIATNLKKAILNHELVLNYQPQIDAVTNEIVGMEALIRWDNAGVFTLPNQFIAIAEERGLIFELGEFIIKQGCTIASKWHKEGILKGKISLNISSKQLIHPYFIKQLEYIMNETGCTANIIEFEIVESSILIDINLVIERLNLLKQKGFNIAIDDFGTGFSSLSYIKNLPVDKLKIDRSFVVNIQNEPKNQAIIQAIKALCDGLDIKVLVEGVETKEELDYMLKYGIHIIQGYYHYKPLSQEEMDSLLKDTFIKKV